MSAKTTTSSSYGYAIPCLIKGMQANMGIPELTHQLREMRIPQKHHALILRKASLQHSQQMAIAFVKERFGTIAPKGFRMMQVLKDYFVCTAQEVLYVIYLCKRKGIYCLCSYEDYKSIKSV